MTRVKCLTQRLRAVDDHDKALRRQSILDAAQRLLEANNGQLPSVMSIAREAGLAKGTVYLYFDTKEEIFLALLGHEYETLLNLIKAAVGADITSEPLIANMVSVITRFLDTNPTFLPLSSMASSVIEQNVAFERVVEFKQMLNQHLAELGQQINRLWPAIPEADACSLLLQTHAIILGLWQMQNWPAHLKPLMMDSVCAALVPDMHRDLECAVRNLWRGALIGTAQTSH